MGVASASATWTPMRATAAAYRLSVSENAVTLECPWLLDGFKSDGEGPGAGVANRWAVRLSVVGASPTSAAYLPVASDTAMSATKRCRWDRGGAGLGRP